MRNLFKYSFLIILPFVLTFCKGNKEDLDLSIIQMKLEKQTYDLEYAARQTQINYLRLIFDSIRVGEQKHIDRYALLSKLDIHCQTACLYLDDLSNKEYDSFNDKDYEKHIKGFEKHFMILNEEKRNTFNSTITLSEIKEIDNTQYALILINLSKVSLLSQSIRIFQQEQTNFNMAIIKGEKND